jgi:uncharacterized membrane protein
MMGWTADNSNPRHALILPAAAMLIVWSEPAMAQCQYEATVLPAIGCSGGAGTPVAINNLGDVLLTRNGCGTPSLHDSLIWTAESGIQPIHPPPGFHGAHVEDLNDSREIVGYAQQQISGPKGTIIIEQACLWRPGETILLGIPTGGNFSIGNAINNNSEICGYWGNNVTGEPALRAFIWRNRVMTDLDLPLKPHSVAEDINDYSQITGWMGGSNVVGSQAFVWSDQSIVTLGAVPGGTTGQGTAIGSNGMVSGYGVVPTKSDPFRRESVQWRGTVAVNCGMLPLGERMIALGGNDFATVGLCDRPNEIGNRGFLYQGATLSDLTLLVDSAIISIAWDINQRGQILAEGRVNGGPRRTLLLSPVGQPQGDISHDCQVDMEDLIAVITEWGHRNSYADADNNGVVDVDDLILVILNW